VSGAWPVERLIERDVVRGELLAFVEGVRVRGGLEVVYGPAGIGKTAVLGTLHEDARQAGMEVLRAVGSELEREFPFGVVLQLVERRVARASEAERADLLAGAAGLAQPLLERGSVGEGDAVASRLWPLLHGLYWVVSNLSERSPLLLVVDDVQWADAPSVAFLEYLAQRADDLPVAIVLGLRTDEPTSDSVARLAGEVARRQHELRPLSRAAVGALVRGRMPHADEPLCRACADASAGNPFYLQELLASLETQHEPTANTLVALTPEAVRRSVARRLARLPAPCDAIARAAAMLGSHATLPSITAISGVAHEEAVEAADVLVAHGLLDGGEVLGFTHPFVRSSVYDAMPSHIRRRLHRVAAEHLGAHGGADVHVARQLLAGEHRGDNWAVERLRRAADASIRAGDPSTAVDYLERALAEPPAAELRVPIVMALAQAEAVAGRPAATDRLLEAVRLAAPGPERATMLLLLGRAHLRTGHGIEAARAFDDGLLEAGDEDAELTAELHAAWFSAARDHAALMAESPARVQAYLEHPPAGVTPAQRALLAHVAAHLAFIGQAREQAVAFAHLAFAQGRLIEEETSDAMTWISALVTLMYADDLDAYEAGIEIVLDDAQRRGSRLAFATASYSRAVARYFRGRLTDAIADLQLSLQAAGDGFYFLPLAHARLAWCELDRDVPEAAAAALAPIENDPYWTQTLFHLYVLEARARVALVQGRPHDALDDAMHGIALAGQFDAKLNPAVIPIRATAALAADAVGNHAQAQALITDEVRLARDFGAPKALGMALRAAGLLARGQRRRSLLEESVATLQSSPAMLEYARALVDLGSAMRRDGDRRAASQALRNGMDLAHRFGALAIERQAREELIAGGARPRRAALSGADALTPSERRVAELAAAGHANRQIAQMLFVTLRTVEAHLSAAYRKLDIHGRAQLAPALEGQD
jgi:DNA-binding CsgD family transcriptional regulator